MDNEKAWQKLEEKIDIMQSEIRVLSERVVELNVTNRHQSETGATHVQRVSELDREMNRAKGAINFIKFVSTIGGAILVSIATWMLSSQASFQQQLADVNREVAVLKSELIKYDTTQKIENSENNHENFRQ